MDHLKAASEAIDRLGGQTAAAKILHLKSHQVVQHWLRNGVPLKLAPMVEKACGGAIRVERMCPHVRWTRVKDAAWPRPAGRPCADFARGLRERAI